MNKYKLKLFIFIVVGVVLFTGCGKKNEQNSNNSAINSKYINLSSTDIKVKNGSTKTFDIVLSKAVGLFSLSSTDDSVATVDEEKVWLEAIGKDTDTKTVVVKGNKIGNTQIVINLADVATFDTEEELFGSYTINVMVE